MNDVPPDEIRDDLARARRLEWWTLFWMGSVVFVMWRASGSSQAMRTALIEDILSLIPAIVFLIAYRFEGRPATAKFPFGFYRVHSLSALIAAVALTFVGGFLLFESVQTLVAQEHPTFEPLSLAGRDIWSGWVMLAALLYSIVPPVILGRIKQPIANRLQDKVLDTDAKMQRADWQTGLAGMAGVVGVGFGLWWADAAAAALIAFSIVKDGVTSLKIATAELVDGTPRALGRDDIDEDAQKLIRALEELYPGTQVRLRETGRYIHAQVVGTVSEGPIDLRSIWPGRPERAWRLVQLSFVPREP